MIRLILPFLLLPFAAACATSSPSDEPALPAPPAFASERLSVEVVGSGPDVVLIPGLSSSPEVWRSTIAAVPGYRYHLVHVAGFAGRPAGANASGSVVEPVAGEIARYIREAGLRRPAIVGHSLGGAWAIMVAGRNAGLVSKAMVVDMLPFLGAMFGGPTATPESVRPIAEQMRTGIATSAGEARRKQIEQTIAGMVRTESLRAGIVEHSLASDPAASGQAMYDLVTADLRPDVAKIKVPLTVLFVRPQGAPVTDAQMEQFYAMSYAGAPQAVLKRIPNSYHFIMLDEPAAFQTELKAFLAN
ncbi:MAG TPA: alpha/beta hydrolase [Allosphingosinicella sp.]|jgi:pimeloyl-ACP methyl ester carboxylesterase